MVQAWDGESVAAIRHGKDIEFVEDVLSVGDIWKQLIKAPEEGDDSEEVIGIEIELAEGWGGE